MQNTNRWLFRSNVKGVEHSVQESIEKKCVENNVLNIANGHQKCEPESIVLQRSNDMKYNGYAIVSDVENPAHNQNAFTGRIEASMVAASLMRVVTRVSDYLILTPTHMTNLLFTCNQS